MLNLQLWGERTLTAKNGSAEGRILLEQFTMDMKTDVILETVWEQAQYLRQRWTRVRREKQRKPWVAGAGIFRSVPYVSKGGIPTRITEKTEITQLIESFSNKVNFRPRRAPFQRNPRDRKLKRVQIPNSVVYFKYGHCAPSSSASILILVELGNNEEHTRVIYLNVTFQNA